MIFVLKNKFKVNIQRQEAYQKSSLERCAERNIKIPAKKKHLGIKRILHM
jgi:hypothetical protein